MRSAKAKGRRPQPQSPIPSGQKASQLSRCGGPWLQSRPKAEYEDEFWALARFARLNRLSMIDAFRICHAPSLDSPKQADGSNPTHPKELFRPRYLWRDREVRFCPICAECGWMPDLFSLPVLVTCPIHHAQLTSDCCVCGSSLSAAKLRSSSHPFLCHFCNESWFGASLDLGAEMGDEWPPDHPGGISRMAMVDETMQRLQKLCLQEPVSYDTSPRRKRSDFSSSLWAFASGTEPQAQEILSAISCSAAAADVYALAFRVRSDTSRPRVRNAAAVRYRIRQYLQLRSELGAYFGAFPWPLHRAGRTRTAQPLIVSDETKFEMICAFGSWRRRFERQELSMDEVFQLRERLWDESVFLDSGVVDDDWIPYCIAEMFNALDKYNGWAPIRSRIRVRRSSVLATAAYPCAAEVRVISAGRWPFLDEIVKEHGCRLSVREVERLAEWSVGGSRRRTEETRV